MIGLAADRDRRRRRRGRRRRGVDDPRAVGAAQAVARPSRPATSPRSPRRWAGGWSTADMPAGVDGLARRGQRAAPGEVRDLPRAAGRVRRPLAPARRRGLGRRLLRRPRGAGAPVGRQAGLTRDEGIRPDSTAETLAALKPSFRPDGTITAGNASPLNDGASALLLGSAAAAARIGTDPIARIAGRGASALRAADVRLRPGRGRQHGAGPGRHRLVGRRRGRAQRGLRRAVAGLRRRLGQGPPTPRSSTPAAGRSRSVTRSAPPAAGSSAPWPPRLRADGGRYGVAAICIGVGQALAVVLENVATEGAGA